MTMMTFLSSNIINLVVNALVDALKGPSTGVFYPLSILARPMYPMREFRPHMAADGRGVIVTICKWGRHYKNRGKKPKTVPPADTEGIKMALNLRLPAAIKVNAVYDEGDYVQIYLEVDENERNFEQG